MSRILVAILVALLACQSVEAAKTAKAKKAKVAARTTQTAEPLRTPFRKSPYVGAVSAGEEIVVKRLPNGKVEKVRSWKTLFESSANQPAYPASVTKLMTLLLVLEDVRAGKYSLDSVVTATPDVYRCEPSWIGLKVGETMSVGDLCMALMVESANDAAIALGVHSAGSFEGFVARMNARASELGMTATKYYNPNGLPPNTAKRYPWKSFNVTTASDQLKLAVALVSMPETFRYTSVKTCDLIKTAGGYRLSVTRRVNEPEMKTELREGEKVVKQMRNHNNIMRMDKLKIFNPDGKEAVDGLKTGYIDAGGSSIVITGTRGGRRAIVVVLGSATAKERDAQAKTLMSDALGTVSW